MAKKIGFALALIVVGALLWWMLSPDVMRQRFSVVAGMPLKIEVPAYAELSADATIPENIKWDSVHGLMEWTPRADQVGEHRFHLKWGALLHSQAVYTVVVQMPSDCPAAAQAVVLPRTTAPQPKVKPTFTTVPPTFVSRGVEWSYRPTVAERGGQGVIFSLKNGPAGMQLDAATRTLRWTPGEASPIHSSITILAENDAGLIEEQVFQLSLNSFYKFGSLGDWPQSVRKLENGMMLGLSQSRLMLFRGGSLNEVVDSYWTAARSARTFLYYKGHVYLRRPPDGLDVLDVSDGQSIKPVGCLPLTVTQYGSTEEGAIEGNILVYPNHRQYGLEFISLENPARPRVVSSLPLGTNRNPYRIITQGRIAFVSGNQFMAAVDFSDVLKPRILSSVTMSFAASAGAFVFYQQHLYSFAKERVIVDASNLEQLKVVSTQVDKENSSTLSFLQGQNLMLFGYSQNTVLDLADPLQPRFIKRYYKSNYKLGLGPEGVYQTIGNEVRLLDGFRPLLDTNAELNGQRYESVTVEGSTAFVLGTSMTRLDLSKPGSPRIVSQTRYNSKHSEVAPLLANGVLFTCNGIYDTRAEGDPKQFVSGSYLGFAREGDAVYALKHKALERWMLDADGKEPARKNGEWPLGIEAVAIAVRGDRVYLAVRKDMIHIFRIGDKELLPTTQFKVPSSRNDPYISDLQIEGERLYAAMNRPGVVALSLRNPDAPEYHGHYLCDQYSSRIAMRNGIACVADGSGGVTIVDFKKTGEAQILNTYPTSDWTTSVALANGFILATDRDVGLQLFAYEPFFDKDPGIARKAAPKLFEAPNPVVEVKPLEPVKETEPVRKQQDF